MQLSKNIKVALLPIILTMSMLGVSYAAVPLYDLFCRMTGFGGTTQVAATSSDRLGERETTIRFDANVVEVPWTFKPEVTSIKVRNGETMEVRYRITNVGDKPVTGIANYNVTPHQAGAYFNKLACFCFTNQTLGPKETREETVVFFVDPAVEQDPNLAGLDTITLSYTFFPAKDAGQPLAASAPLVREAVETR
jgi:cytochrome c oxidase assembly protein subunit 11